MWIEQEIKAAFGMSSLIVRCNPRCDYAVEMALTPSLDRSARVAWIVVYRVAASINRRIKTQSVAFQSTYAVEFSMISYIASESLSW